jgi:L-ascorbate metabolism protein UlaG (beta-lactamase superfamily)
MAKLTFLGHAAFIVTGGGKTILIDPFLEGNPVATASPDAISCDYIAVTHAHGDHLGDTIAIARRTGATVIANNEIAVWADQQGVKSHPMHIGGSHEFPFGRVKLTIAHHGSSFPDGTYGGNPAGLILTIDGKRIHHTGDTALTHDMSFAGDEGLDVVLIPIGDNFTMGVDDALRALDFLRPKVVVPIHYDTWPLIAADVSRFATGAKEKGVVCRVLEPGATLDV